MTKGPTGGFCETGLVVAEEAVTSAVGLPVIVLVGSCVGLKVESSGLADVGLSVVVLFIGTADGLGEQTSQQSYVLLACSKQTISPSKTLGFGGRPVQQACVCAWVGAAVHVIQQTVSSWLHTISPSTTFGGITLQHSNFLDVGRSVGSIVTGDNIVFAAVGLNVGPLVGAGAGLLVGLKSGPSVGTSKGLPVGPMVGPTEELSVDDPGKGTLEAGLAVGSAVGSMVGSGVGPGVVGPEVRPTDVGRDVGSNAGSGVGIGARGAAVVVAVVFIFILVRVGVVGGDIGKFAEGVEGAAVGGPVDAEIGLLVA